MGWAGKPVVLKLRRWVGSDCAWPWRPRWTVRTLFYGGRASGGKGCSENIRPCLQHSKGQMIYRHPHSGHYLHRTWFSFHWDHFIGLTLSDSSPNPLPAPSLYRTTSCMKINPIETAVFYICQLALTAACLNLEGHVHRKPKLLVLLDKSMRRFSLGRKGLP